MALIGQIAINMKVDTKDLNKGLRTASKVLVAFQTQAASSFRVLAAGIAGVSAVSGIYKLVSAGSDLVENQNKVKAVFGESSKAVIDASEQMNLAFGVSKTEFQDAAGVLGGLFKNLGYTSGDAAQLSVQMVKLAADLASFKNLSFDEALLKIRAGLTGESEPLKAIGILINETAVKTEAYAMKIAKVNSELTEQQKVQARLSILMKQTKDAQGDLAKTADDVANSARGVQGRFESLAASLGTALQPLAKEVLGQLQQGILAAQIAWDGYGQSAVAATSSTVGAIEAQAEPIGFLQAAIGKVADAWKYVELGLLALSANVTPVIVGLIDVVGLLFRAIDKVADIAGYGAIGVGQFFTDMAKGLEDAGKATNALFNDKLKDLFEGGPKASEGINKYFDESRKKIQALRAEANKPGVDVNSFKPKPGAATKGKLDKHAEALVYGSSEAANTILRSAGGGKGSGTKDVAETAKNTAQTNKILVEINKKMTGGGGPILVQDFA